MKDAQLAFRRNRISFAIVNGELKFTMHDKRTSKEWLKQLYSIETNEYEQLVRGYMRNNKIFFYKTSNYDIIDIESINTQALSHLHMLAMVYMDTCNLICYSGLKQGNDGEEWEPIKRIGSLHDIIKYRKNTLC